MFELSWNDVDFTKDFYFKNSSLDRHKSKIKEVFVLMSTLILILGGLLIVAYTGISLYTIYTHNEQVKMALQMAKDENRQIVLNTDNNFKITANVSNKSTFGFAGDNASITRITIYPRNYYPERVTLPGGQTITPYSLTEEF